VEGCRVGRCWLRWAARGRGSWVEVGPHENKKKEGKKRLAGPGSASSWVSAHCLIGIRNSFSFSNLFIFCKLI
jgi:hypothetical protein